MTVSSRNPDVLSFGEVLVDLFPDRQGIKLRDAAHFVPQLGGAPANLAFGVAMAGGRAGLLSMVGADEFGELVCVELARVGVDVSGVRRAARGARTGLAFVQIDETGERSFLFYRRGAAETTLSADDIDVSQARSTTIAHAGSNLLMWDQPREATLAVWREAREGGAITSLDANIREHLWPNPADIRPSILAALEHIDIFKANDEELELLWPAMSPRAIHSELTKIGVTLLVATHGRRGATVVTPAGDTTRPAPTVEAIDSTGAGDAFLAGFLLATARFCPNGRNDLIRLANDREPWRSCLALGNYLGATACTRFGATAALPGPDDIPFDELGVPGTPTPVSASP